MKVTFLGRMGWYDSKLGNTLSILVESDSFYIILDAGFGIAKADEYISGKKDTLILLSHLHIDHICGLHVLFKFKCFDRLTICAPDGQAAFLNSFLNYPFTVAPSSLPYKVMIKELPSEIDTLPFNIKCCYLEHPVPTLGYRIEFEKKIIVYCPDTDVCDNAVQLAMEADLLITECAYLPGETYEKWPHLNPEKAAYLARKAKVKKLALIHFDSSRYADEETIARAGEAASEVFPALEIPEDGTSLEV